jgi:hypothetical protein
LGGSWNLIFARERSAPLPLSIPLEAVVLEIARVLQRQAPET